MMHRIKLGLPSIGGKDSMSGTFNDIDVPPTLCSFAVDVAEISDVVTNELKKAGSRLVKFTIQKDEYDLPDFAFIMSQYEKITKLMRDGVILSAQAVDGNGVADAVAKMAFGNKIGAKFCKHKPKEYFFTPGYGEIVAEIDEEDLAVLDAAGVLYEKIGKTLVNRSLSVMRKCFYGGSTFGLEWHFGKSIPYPFRCGRQRNQYRTLRYERHLCMQT